MKQQLKLIVEENTTLWGKRFDLYMQALILLSLVAFAIDTLPNLPVKIRLILNVVEVISVAIFTVEYILRLYVADRPLKYMLSFYGIIDLLAIMPFYLRLAIDLRALRIFRVFRVFRALKLIRYNRAFNRFYIAFQIIKEELVLFFITAAIFIFLAAAGIYFFEHKAQPEPFKSVLHSLWWAIVTLTTVGYGDVYPVTVGGRIFTYIILIIGVGIVSVPAGLVASSLSKAREIEAEQHYRKTKAIPEKQLAEF